MTTYEAPQVIEDLAAHLAAAVNLRELPEELWVAILLEVPKPYRPIDEAEFKSLVSLTRRLYNHRFGRRASSRERRQRVRASAMRGLFTSSDRRRAAYEMRRRGEL